MYKFVTTILKIRTTHLFVVIKFLLSNCLVEYLLETTLSVMELIVVSLIIKFGYLLRRRKWFVAHS